MKYKTQEELETKAKERINDRWKAWSDYHEKFWKEYKKINSEYYCEMDTSSENTRRRSKLKYPTLFTLIETLKPITFEALVGERPYLATSGRNLSDEPAAEVIQDYNTFMLDQAEFPCSYYPFEHNRTLLGTAYAYAPWEMRFGMRRRDVEIDVPVMGIDPMTGATIQTGTQKQTVKKELDVKVKDNVDFKNIDPWDIVYDPSVVDARDISWKGEGVIRQWYTTKEEIKKNARKIRSDGSFQGMYDKDSVDECLKQYKTSLEQNSTDAARGFSDEYAVNKNDVNQQMKGKLLIREGWMQLPVSKSKVTRKKGVETEELQWDEEAPARECVVTLCVTTNTILRIIANPTDEQFRPFIASVCYPVPGRLPGLCFGTIIMGILKEMEIIKNSRLDYINFILNRPWIVNVHSGINVRDLFNVPNKIIKARDINGLKPVDIPDFGSAAYRDLDALNAEIQNSSGVMSAIQQGSGLGDTATGVNYFQNMINARIKVIVKLAEYQCMVPLGRFLFNYAKQFVTTEEFFKVMDKESPYGIISPDSYNMMIDFIPAGAYDRITKGQQIALLDRFLTILPTVKDMIKVEEVLRDYMKMTGIATNTAKYMLSPEEQQQRQQMANAPVEKPIDPKLSMTFKGETLPPQMMLEIVAKEYGVQLPQIPNVLNPQTMPVMPGTIVNPQGMPTGGMNGEPGTFG